jgi:hypothetical protein
MMNQMEAAGTLPHQLEIVLMVLLAKPQGGHRPIAILPAFYRLWMKIRRPLLEKWERQWHRPFFAMAEGQSPGDSVWRSAVLKEAAIGMGKQTATLLWDMKKAYEVISFDRLWREAKALGFPLVILRICLAMYASERYVRMNGMVQAAGRACRGMCAGCGAATTLIKVSYLRPLEVATEKIPRIRIKIFVDDLQLDQEDTEEDIVKFFPASAALVLKVIKEELGADIAEDKAVLIASNNNLATVLRAAIGEAAGKPAVLATKIGHRRHGRQGQADHGQGSHPQSPVGQGSQSGEEAQKAQPCCTHQGEAAGQDQPGAQERVRSPGHGHGQGRAPPFAEDGGGRHAAVLRGQVQAEDPSHQRGPHGCGCGRGCHALGQGGVALGQRAGGRSTPAHGAATGLGPKREEGHQA